MERSSLTIGLLYLFGTFIVSNFIFVKGLNSHKFLPQNSFHILQAVAVINSHMVYL